MSGTHSHDDVPLDATAGAAARGLRIGIGGPVGTGKTALIAQLCHQLVDVSLAVVTNDIYTTEDADFLRRRAVLPDDRIVAVATGCCPHTAVRDDIAANLDAVERLEATHPDLKLVLLESGGDNLTLTWSRALVDHQVFVIDVAGGDKIPRKGGPGISSSDLLVINKVDLAASVGADLDVMDHDAREKRGDRATVFTDLRTQGGSRPVADWVRSLLAATPATATASASADRT